MRVRLRGGIHWITVAALYALFELGIYSGFAQTATLRGKVTDAQTGEPLVQANVLVTPVGIRGKQTGDASDLAGHFEVSGLVAGIYRITVSYIGYEQQVAENLELNADEKRVLNFALIPTAIIFNPLVVSASRRQEKALEAPAALSVVEIRQVRNRPALSATDYLRGLPAVDVESHGIAQSNVVVRGFNNVLNDMLLSFTDNRYAHVPGLRVNVYSLIPLTNEDISRIEVVSGPASALYGPNSANGVMHIITRSPFESEGTTISIGGGGRDFFNLSRREPHGGRNIYLASLRHAGRFSDNIGFKISAQYYRGRDWESFDPAEPDSIVFGRQTGADRIAVSDMLPNQRDFNVENIASEARVDFRLSDDATLILNGGISQADQIELTDVGSAQVKDWTYNYAQARFSYRSLFVQGFVNASNAGDTYLLRTGDLIEDKSKVFVGQVQHGVSIGERQRFTYGFDAQLTRPNSNHTLYGRNEDKDDINEFGIYLQSETIVTSVLDLVTAARLDDHNHVDGLVFSPRAAFVFKPTAEHNFRLTYNRAYRTPSAANLFLDILSENVPSDLPPPFPSTLIAVRLRGLPSESGFTFRRDNDGRPLMMSQLAPGLGYVPSTVNSVWPTLRQVLIAGAPVGKQSLLDAALPQQFTTTVTGDLRKLNPTTEGFDLVADVKDIPPLRPPIHNTYEFGYKGVAGDKLFVAVDVYHTRVKDFVGPFKVETPNVFANPEQLYAALQPTAEAIANILISQGEPPDQAQAEASAIIDSVLAAATQLPLGVISPEQIANDTDVILTYRNLGKISYNGLDLALAYYASQHWIFSGNYSFVTRSGFNIFSAPNCVIFKNVDGVADIALNAPGHKAGLSVGYRDSKTGFDAELRARYVEGFPMEAGVHVGEVHTYTVFDANFAYDLPFSKNTRVSLSAQNLFDKKHREFVNAPELGRLVLVRVVQQF